MESEDDTFTHATGLGCALESFTEVEEVSTLIKSLPETCHDASALELQLQRFETVLNCYQEQPHLLDPHLPSMLLSLLNMMLESSKNETQKNNDLCHAAAAMAAHLLKVRKAKVANKHFPHEVHHLQPVLRLLERQDCNSSKWKTSHVLLYWLSMLVLIPFELRRFDGSDETTEKDDDQSLRRRLDVIIKHFLQSRNANQRAAAFLAAKFVTRPDMVASGHLRSFIDDINVALMKSENVEQRVGALMALAAVAKIGKRNELGVDLINTTLSNVIEVINVGSSSSSVLLRRLRLKTLARLGLLLMKTRVASWRYCRGNRSLAINLGVDTSDDDKSKEVERTSEVEDEEIDIPDVIEDVIDQLLNGLRDRSTLVRWSAAKGIGRITNRLSLEMADEVLAAVLELCDDSETDAAWHGAALTIAELGRRGLIPPKRLESVLAAVSPALVYDERKGNLSVGSQIRDAACYVCWSFARAYDSNVIASFIEEVSRQLIVVIIFDREVSCRRAASAAFQELVGRQGGLLKHGLDIITKADYFAVGSRPRAFLELSVFVADLDTQYAKALVEHLIDVKFRHWDAKIRELSALAVQKLCAVSKAREVILDSGLQKVLKLASCDDDLFGLHGGVLAVGHIVNGLVHARREDEKGENVSVSRIYDTLDLEPIRNVGENLSARIALRPSGIDLLRQGLASYIDQLSAAAFPVHSDSATLDLWRNVLLESLCSSNEELQSIALTALQSFVSSYYFEEDSSLKRDQRDNLLTLLFELCSVSETHRRGAVLALGNFPKAFLENRFDEVLQKLIACAQITSETDKWAEARRDTVAAISKLVIKSNSQENTSKVSVSANSLHKVYDLLESGMSDYTVDRRGDIGAWVREACMNAFFDLTLALVDDDEGPNNELLEQHVSSMLPLLAQQALEKIDRTRGLAASLLAKLVFYSPTLPGLKHAEWLRGSVFGHDIDLETFSFSKEADTFPMLVKLLRMEDYRLRVVQGLIVSVGGLTESLVRHASKALYTELDKMDERDVEDFFKCVLDVFEQHQHLDRVTLPLLKFLDILLSSGHLDPVLMKKDCDEFGLRLIELIKKEIQRSSDPGKLMNSVAVFCALLHTQDERLRRKALVQLSIFLCHRFPRIRVYTANQLFDTLIAVDHVVDEDSLESAQNILSETMWDQGVDVLRPIRNNLCEMLNIPTPAVVKKS